MPVHNGYPRVSSQLLCRTSSTGTLPGLADAGSTCLPLCSLLKRHHLFSERHKRDRFSYDYMRWLAHHEFGLTHKPFRFGTDESSRNSMYDPSNINYWVNLWRSTYSYVLEVMPERSVLVCYENLCARPAESMDKILRLAGIE